MYYISYVSIFALITLHSFGVVFPSVCCLKLIKTDPGRQRPAASSLNTRTHMIECATLSVCGGVWVWESIHTCLCVSVCFCIFDFDRWWLMITPVFIALATVTAVRYMLYYTQFFYRSRGFPPGIQYCHNSIEAHTLANGSNILASASVSARRKCLTSKIRE